MPVTARRAEPARTTHGNRTIRTATHALLGAALTVTWAAGAAVAGVHASRADGLLAVATWVLAVGIVVSGLAAAAVVVTAREPLRRVVRLPDDTRRRERQTARKLAAVPNRQQLRAELNASADIVETKIRCADRASRRHTRALAVVEAILGDAVVHLPVADEGLRTETAAALLTRIATDRPAEIVHVGGGETAALLALGAERCGTGRVVVIARDDASAARTAARLDELGLAHVARVVRPALATYAMGGETVRWFDVGGLELDGPIGLLVVDPPAGSIDPVAREPAVPALRTHLDEHTVVVVDRTDTPEGRQLLHRWCRHAELRLHSEVWYGDGAMAELRLAVPASRERYVVVKGRFGLGDRIAAVLSATDYAHRTGRRLVVDWDDPTYRSAHVGDVYRSLLRSPASDDVDLRSLTGHSVHPNEWTGLLTAFRGGTDDRTMPYHLSSARPPADDVGEEIVVVTRRAAHDAWMPSAATDLAPSEPLGRAIDEFAARHFCGDVLGVHVRHGNGEFLVRPPRTAWFHERIDEHVERHGPTTLFLATDSIEVDEEFRDRHGGIVDVVTVPKWFAPPGSGALHGHPDCPDPFQGAIDALTDMWLLARCRWLLLSPGVFAQVVRALSRLADDAVSTYDARVHPRLREKRGWRAR